MSSYIINKFKYSDNTYNFQDAGALQLTSESEQTVSGPVSFEDSVSIDDATAGNLVVTGAASFTNNLQANTINGVTVGNSPKFTDTITTVGTTGSGNAVTAITASNGALTVTKGTTFLTSFTETDPTVPSWAKQSSKPTYTASEVGALSSSTTYVSTITTTAGAHTAITNKSGTVSFNVPTTAAHVGAATSDHVHGNITNGGDITATAPTIASGDQIIINDNSASKITNGPTFDGSTTTTALTPKGTWESFTKVQIVRW